MSAIKVLVATADLQGARHSDYHFCIEGELVWIAPMCTPDRRNPDAGCHCGRGFTGLTTHETTTTAKVRTLEDVTHADYVEALGASLDEQGYDPSWASHLADSLLEIAGELSEHTVVEHRLDYVQVRELTPP